MKTPWLPKKIKPVHYGVYEVLDCKEIYASYWDGKYWSVAIRLQNHSDTLPIVFEAAEEFKDIKTKSKYVWRGIHRKKRNK